MPKVVCDFCNKDGVTWSYPAKSFVLDFPIPQASLGNWAACNDCHDAIEQRGVEGSIDCTVRSMYMFPESLVREYATQLHTLFFANRTGPAVPFKDA